MESGLTLKGHLRSICNTYLLTNPKHFVRIILAWCRWRQRLAAVLVQGNRFIDKLTKLGENLLFVIAMTAAIKKPGTTADKTLVFVRPFHNFYVMIFFVHFFDSSIAASTALSWYFLASSPCLPENHRFHHQRMDKISMAAFAASINKSGFFQLADEFSNFLWHWRCRYSFFVSSVLILYCSSLETPLMGWIIAAVTCHFTSSRAALSVLLHRTSHRPDNRSSDCPGFRKAPSGLLAAGMTGLYIRACT